MLAVFISVEFRDKLVVLIVMMYVTGGQLELVVEGRFHISNTEFTESSIKLKFTAAFGAAVICNIYHEVYKGTFSSGLAKFT